MKADVHREENHPGGADSPHTLGPKQDAAAALCLVHAERYGISIVFDREPARERARKWARVIDATRRRFREQTGRSFSIERTGREHKIDEIVLIRCFVRATYEDCYLKRANIEIANLGFERQEEVAEQIARHLMPNPRRKNQASWLDATSWEPWDVAKFHDEERDVLAAFGLLARQVKEQDEGLKDERVSIEQMLDHYLAADY